MAISTRMSRNPVTPSAQSPSIGARPSSSRPSSVKNSMAASMSSTTMPTLSIRLTVMMFPWRLTPRISRPPDRRQICVCKFDDWLVGRLHAFVRRRRSGTVYGPPHAVQVELRSVRTHVPAALLQNRARILIRLDRAKIPRERAMLCADALELLRIRNKGRDLLPVPQRARPAEQRSRSCMRELRNFEIEERAPVARPAPAHAGPAQASLQDAEGQALEILVVGARFLAGKAAAALLLCERTLPGRAVAHSIFRHMNDEDGTLRRLTLAVTGRSEQREPRSGAARCYAVFRRGELAGDTRRGSPCRSSAW